MGSITSTSIANMALSLLGVTPVISIEDNLTQKPAKVMNVWYEPTRDEVIRSATWTFARDRAALAQLATAPDFGWDYQYQLPNNPKCLRVLAMVENYDSLTNLREYEYNGEGTRYVIEGDKLLTNEETANILFLKRVTDTSKFDALFIKTLAYKLAHDACFDITGSNERQGILWNGFMSMLNLASGVSAIEHFRLPDKDNSWINAGRGNVLDYNVKSRLTG